MAVYSSFNRFVVRTRRGLRPVDDDPTDPLSGDLPRPPSTFHPGPYLGEEPAHTRPRLGVPESLHTLRLAESDLGLDSIGCPVPIRFFKRAETSAIFSLKDTVAVAGARHFVGLTDFDFVLSFVVPTPEPAAGNSLCAWVRQNIVGLLGFVIDMALGDNRYLN